MSDNEKCSVDLAQSSCAPCQGGVEPLKGRQIQPFLDQLTRGWQVVAEHHIEKEFKFKNFRQALDFTNKVGELAESVGHHPDIYLAWGMVKLTVRTHKINGLHQSDFIFAAKVDQIGS